MLFRSEEIDAVTSATSQTRYCSLITHRPKHTYTLSTANIQRYVLSLRQDAMVWTLGLEQIILLFSPLAPCYAFWGKDCHLTLEEGV